MKIIGITTLLLFSLEMSQAHASEKQVNLDGREDKSEFLRTHLYTPPELILPQYQAIKDVSELLEKHGITYWVAFGTLIGALRQKDQGRLPGGGIIPHDDDGDLGFDIKDEAKLTSALFKEDLFALGYKLQADDLVGYKVMMQKSILNPKTNQETNIFVDLFPSILKEGKYILYGEAARARWPNGWFYDWQIEQRQKVGFGSFSIFAPKDGHLYCERAHGKYWNTVGHYYFNHHGDYKGTQYIWTLEGDDLKPAQPLGPLEDRVK